MSEVVEIKNTARLNIFSGNSDGLVIALQCYFRGNFFFIIIEGKICFTVEDHINDFEFCDDKEVRIDIIRKEM